MLPNPPISTSENDPTSELLDRWARGERRALDKLLSLHLEEISRHIEKRLGRVLRRKGDAQDYVHDVVVEFLKYAPRFRLSDSGHFRALLGRMIENVLCDHSDRYMALRRNPSKERPLPNDSVLELDPPARPVTTPSRVAQRHEREAWIRLGLDLLNPEDRDLIVARQWERQSFTALADRMGMAPDAVRMRFHRAVGRLAGLIGDIRRGGIAAMKKGRS